jgi:hypothetical protein
MHLFKISDFLATGVQSVLKHDGHHKPDHQDKVVAVIDGLLFVSVTVSGLTLFDMAVWVQLVFSGCALVAAVLIDHWFQKFTAAGS